MEQCVGNLVSIVEFPTRFGLNSQTAIDNVLIDTSTTGKYDLYPLINGLSDYDAQLLIYIFFLKEFGFISDGLLQRVHNLSSVTTVPVTSYNEVVQNVDLYLFNWGGVRCSSEKLTQYEKHCCIKE